MPGQQQPYRQQPGRAPQNGRRVYAPMPPQGPSMPPRRPAPPNEQARRAAARRARQIRRNRRRLALVLVAVGILGVSGIITLLLPAPPADAPAQPTQGPPAAASAQLVAPLPYNGADGTAEAPAVDWGTVGPRRQDEGYVYTAAPAAPPATLPVSGQVDISWFSDAAFLGDSITAGLQEYNINLSGALVCGYVGASPNQIVNRTTLTNPERGEEIPLDVLAARQPRKVYVLMGTNALRLGGSDESFLGYYGAMLDALQAALPDAAIYVQPVLPVRPEALADSPGLATDRLRTVDQALLALCEEKGCYYLDLYEVFADENGALPEDYAEADGIHLKVSGYRAWLNYLCTHVPYNKQNPYQPGAEFYINDTVKALLADIP